MTATTLIEQSVLVFSQPIQTTEVPRNAQSNFTDFVSTNTVASHNIQKKSLKCGKNEQNLLWTSLPQVHMATGELLSEFNIKQSTPSYLECDLDDSGYNWYLWEIHWTKYFNPLSKTFLYATQYPLKWSILIMSVYIHTARYI